MVLVARPIGPSELKLLPEAAHNVDEEWESCAMCTWIENRACEYEAARSRALEDESEAPVGRLCAL